MIESYDTETLSDAILAKISSKNHSSPRMFQDHYEFIENDFIWDRDKWKAESIDWGRHLISLTSHRGLPSIYENIANLIAGISERSNIPDHLVISYFLPMNYQWTREVVPLLPKRYQVSLKYGAHINHQGRKQDFFGTLYTLMLYTVCLVKAPKCEFEYESSKDFDPTISLEIQNTCTVPFIIETKITRMLFSWDSSFRSRAQVRKVVKRFFNKGTVPSKGFHLGSPLAAKLFFYLLLVPCTDTKTLEDTLEFILENSNWHDWKEQLSELIYSSLTEKVKYLIEKASERT